MQLQIFRCWQFHFGAQIAQLGIRSFYRGGFYADAGKRQRGMDKAQAENASAEETRQQGEYGQAVEASPL